MRYAYSLLLYGLAPLVLLRLWLRSLRAPAYRARIAERFGWVEPLPEKGGIWVHAVSVGEVQAASPLIRALLERHPQRPLLVTTTTPTGADQVRRLFDGQVRHGYLPYDLPDAVWRFLGRTRPALGLIMETEIWPNLFHACRARGIPLMLVNARLSERSARGYRRFRRLTRQTLDCLAAVAAQGQADARRLADLGMDPARIQVTGNTKFDVQIPPSVREQGEVLRREWQLRPVWVAGSTHEGEEAMVLETHRRVLQLQPDALLVLVPRHPERFGEVAVALKGGGWRFARRSAGEEVSPETQVYLADTMGELPVFYAAASAAFVGGSLVAVGGHNPLEPAALGVPVLMGAHHFNFAEVVALLRSAGGLEVVKDAPALARAVAALLSDPDGRHRRGECARQVVEENRGARERVLGLVEEALAGRLSAARR